LPTLWDVENWKGLSNELVVSLVVESVEVGVGSLCVGSDPVVVVISTLISGAVTGALGVTGTDMPWFVGFTGLLGFNGLTGDVGFVGLLSDLTHESAVVVHPLQMGVAYGVGQEDICVCVIAPINPVAQLRVCV
jgi:hypothetical protein